MTGLLLESTESLDLRPLLAHYATYGWGRVGLALNPEGLSALRARADEIMDGRRPSSDFFFQHDTSTGSYQDLRYGHGWEGPSRNYRKIEKLERDDLFLSWIQNPLFARIAAEVIGGPIVLYRAILMNKAATGGTELPWHQDGGSFWGLSRDPVLQIWTALDEVPEEAGCVEVVPGSHRDGLATPLGGLIPAEVARSRSGAAQKIPARAGEVLLLHNYVWHRSAANSTRQPRRAFSVCFMSADTRCMRRKRAPRTFVRVFG